MTVALQPREGIPKAVLPRRWRRRQQRRPPLRKVDHVLQGRSNCVRFEPLKTLAVSLSLRSSILLQAVDFEESMALFRSALEEEYAHPHAKYDGAEHFRRSRSSTHPTTSRRARWKGPSRVSNVAVLWSGRRCAGCTPQWTSFARMVGWQRCWQSGSWPSAKNSRTSLRRHMHKCHRKRSRTTHVMPGHRMTATAALTHSVR